MGKYVLMERDDVSLTPELERLFSLTPSWATNRGWTCITREPFHTDLAEKIQPFFDTFRVGVSYCLAPWSLTCPWNNSDHLNVHRCGIVCRCSVVEKDGNHFFRKQKEPVCSCDGKFNSHHCNYSNTICPKPRFRLWANRKLSILSFKEASEIILRGAN